MDEEGGEPYDSPKPTGELRGGGKRDNTEKSAE